MAWEASVGPAEEPVSADAATEDADVSAAPGDAAPDSAVEPQCSGSEDGKADEQEQDASAQADQSDQAAPQVSLPRVRLPQLGRLPVRCLPFLAADIADLLTVGLTPVQMNILGSFVTSLGDLISTIAARSEADENNVVI